MDDKKKINLTQLDNACLQNEPDVNEQFIVFVRDTDFHCISKTRYIRKLVNTHYFKARTSDVILQLEKIFVQIPTHVAHEIFSEENIEHKYIVYELKMKQQITPRFKEDKTPRIIHIEDDLTVNFIDFPLYIPKRIHLDQPKVPQATQLPVGNFRVRMRNHVDYLYKGQYHDNRIRGYGVYYDTSGNPFFIGKTMDDGRFCGKNIKTSQFGIFNANLQYIMHNYYITLFHNHVQMGKVEGSVRMRNNQTRINSIVYSPTIDIRNNRVFIGSTGGIRQGGTIYFFDGRLYEGEIWGFKPDGKGTMYKHDDDDEKDEFPQTGEWKRGTYIKNRVVQDDEQDDEQDDRIEVPRVD
jgi:hypothetical protein